MDQRLGVVQFHWHTRRGKQFGVAGAVVAQGVVARDGDIGAAAVASSPRLAPVPASPAYLRDPNRPHTNGKTP